MGLDCNQKRRITIVIESTTKPLIAYSFLFCFVIVDKTKKIMNRIASKNKKNQCLLSETKSKSKSLKVENLQ